MDSPVDYIAKLIQAGLSDEQIAQRLSRCGVTREAVRSFRAQLRDALVLQQHGSNGYQQLSEAVSVMAHQFQLFGESLSGMTSFLSGIATLSEVSSVTGDDAVAKALMSEFVVFRKFTPSPTQVTDPKLS